MERAPAGSVDAPPGTSSDAAASTQGEVSAEIGAVAQAYGRARAAGAPEEAQPRLQYPPYRSSVLRSPRHAAVPVVDPEAVELCTPVFGERDVEPRDADLTSGSGGDPIGERMVVTGRVLDAAGRPVAGQLVEVWQANAAGRYAHARDQHPAPLDPHFTGAGRCLTGADGSYRFTTVKPGPYPWRNHHNAWRPAHIHFSLFGTAFTQRLVTQMYFPGDPLFDLDPIYQSIVDPAPRERLVATYDHDVTVHEWATGYRWDIVLGGPRGTWTEEAP